VQNTVHKLDVLVPPVNSLEVKLEIVFFVNFNDFTFLFFMIINFLIVNYLKISGLNNFVKILIVVIYKIRLIDK